MEDQKPSYRISEFIYLFIFISIVAAPLFHQTGLDAVAEKVEKQHHGG